MKPIELIDILLQKEKKHFIVKDLDQNTKCYFSSDHKKTECDECILMLNKEIRDFAIEEETLILIVSDFNDKEREKIKIRCKIYGLKTQIKELEKELEK